MSANLIGLADTIDNLREELAEASRRGEGKDLRFRIDGIELEVAVAISREGGGGGKVKFEVLGIGAEIGGEGGLSRNNTHRITLKLRPDSESYRASDDMERPD